MADSSHKPDVDMSPPGREKLDEVVGKFRTDVQTAAANQVLAASLDVVSAQHIEDAAQQVCRHSIHSRAAGDNPQLWWIMAGFFYAIALALPDAAAMFIGGDDTSDQKGWWLVTKGVFAILMVVGSACAGRSFWISLGPLQPAWIKRLIHGMQS